MSNLKTLKPFKKGKDERRNTKGRPPQPKNFAEFRQVIQDFLNEPQKNKTRLLNMLDKMANTRGERKILLEYMVGKVPIKLEGTGDDGEIVIKFKDESSVGKS
jgi:hypothetical protein